MVHNVLVLCAAGVAVASFGANTAHAATTAADYNLYVLGNMTAKGSDTEGRIAVGGNVDLQSYAVGEKTGTGGTDLVAGGKVTGNSGSNKGAIVAGGAVTLSSWGNAGGYTQNATALPVDFVAEAGRLTTLTGNLAGFTSNGVTNAANVNPYWDHGYQITLTGTNAGLNVFTVNAADLAKTNTFNINISGGDSVLINVIGSSVDISNMGIALSGISKNKILWNFADATSFTNNGVGVLGSVLAPKATYTGGYSGGNFDGQLIVGNFNGTYGNSTQVNYHMYEGTLLGYAPPVSTPGLPSGGGHVISPGAVPEPGIWAQMIAGFGILGGSLRILRRRSTLAIA